jgi:SAM-dependent methyltransferase
MAPFYARARQVPAVVCTTIIREGNICPLTAVLDIGTGVGSVALQLAAASRHVTGIDISEPFLAVARQTATERGLDVSFTLASANKLAFRRTKYDVIIASQVLHWLEPVWAFRGIQFALPLGGVLFVIEIKPVLPSSHPLRTVLHIGDEDYESVRRGSTIQCNNYCRLFQVLHDSQSAVTPDRVWLFRQTRTFDFEFAKAFFFANCLRRAMPGEVDPWQRLRELMQEHHLEGLRGQMYWMLLSMRKRSIQDSHFHALPMPRKIEDI